MNAPTGFIGGATLARLLQARLDCRVLLLVRGVSPNMAAQRVRRSLGRAPRRCK